MNSSQPIRVFHFADTHFGVELHGRMDPETGLNTRLMDFKRSLTKAIETALARGIDLAVFAGDAYKTRDPRQTDQREFAHCLRRLTDAGVPVALLTGNHDMPAIRGRANAVEIYRTLGVTNVHVFSKKELRQIETPRGPARIAALPYLIKGLSVGREEFQGKSLDEARQLIEAKYVGYLQELADEVRAANDSIPTILLGHFWVNGARLSTYQQGYLLHSEPKVPLSALTDPAFDYVALGHIHKHQDLNPNGQPHVVYAGSPDRIDFGEKDETKGFVLVNLSKGGAEYEFIPIAEGRPFLEITVDAEGPEPMEAIRAEIRRHALRNAIVKLTYRVGPEQLGLVQEREIREALSGAFLVVSVNRSVRRESSERSRLFKETLGPREALELFIDQRPDWLPRKAQLLERAEELFQELNDPD